MFLSPPLLTQPPPPENIFPSTCPGFVFFYGRREGSRLVCFPRRFFKSHILVLEDLEEERWKEFIGTLHLHVEEAAGVARSDHAQVRHLHQQLGPEVGNGVLAVVDVVLERQQVGLLALLDLIHAGQARTIW